VDEVHVRGADGADGEEEDARAEPDGEDERPRALEGPDRRQARHTLPQMAQVAPAEHELRRVIGDGEGIPDREVEGLGEADLLELHRSLVLLRTYDERSLVYHRQGRIGTYAIFWTHEAMQAGAVQRLGAEDWIFPSYRESAIGLLRGM